MNYGLSNWSKAARTSFVLVLSAVFTFADPGFVFGLAPEHALNRVEVAAKESPAAVPAAREASSGRVETVVASASSTGRSRNILIRSRTALVVDIQKGEVIYQKNATSPFPVASITKLMTAVTYMRTNPDLEKRVRITRKDTYRANWTKLRYSEQASALDLLYATLMASDNVAARALARASGLTMEAFVARMNETATELGLSNSRFTEPTGLDPGNVSSAVDCVALLWNALQDELLAEVLMAKEYKFGTNRLTHTIQTTNRLMRNTVSGRQWTCVGSKTGYIRKAGYCLVVRALGDSGDDIFAVVLGGPSSRTRFLDMTRLLDWSMENESRSVTVDG